MMERDAFGADAHRYLDGEPFGELGDAEFAAADRLLAEVREYAGRLEDVAPALDEAVREPGPYLLNVRVSQYENVYPMVPAGAAINEMVLAPPRPVAVPK